MKPWWNVYETKNDDFQILSYKIDRRKRKYTLDDLSSISKEKPFSLYPGYFDFDLLTATTDRYNIYYEGRKRRGDLPALFKKALLFLSNFHDKGAMDILSNLSSSQLNNIEEALANKLKSGDMSKMAATRRKYSCDLLKQPLKMPLEVYGRSLREETRCLFINSLLNGLLMDTIFIFRHMIKEEKEIGE